MKNYYEYEVEMFEEFQVKTYQGITYGNDFAEALRNVADYYDEENLNSVKIIPWDCEGCISLSKNALNEIRENH